MNTEYSSMKIFRFFLLHYYTELYNWKTLAYSIYHLEHLINHFNNYQIKIYLQQHFSILSKYFLSFMKNLITIQMHQSNNINIDQIEDMKNHLNNFKEIILNTKKQFNLCQIDMNTIENLLRIIDEIKFDGRSFDENDRNKIDLLSLKEKLEEKSTKNDLIQMKISLDNQIKKLFELYKENTQKLDQIQHYQTIVSSHSKFIRSHQTSRPYITFELDQIRKYQRQALIQTPFGTIPLYRRQAWAAANLFPDHSLPFLHHMQKSLQMQIHDLLKYDPLNICKLNRKKMKINKSNNDEIFNRTDDILIMGNNNQLYRGQIKICEKIPLKKVNENYVIKTRMNIEQNLDLNIDQPNEKIIDEHLFEYLDWHVQFNEQDLPNEICEELFNHWTSIIYKDQSCHCDLSLKSKIVDIQSNSLTSLDMINDDQCLCSQCSCNCEKIHDDQSICLCSQCSCQCLKDFLLEQHEQFIEDQQEKCQENEVNQIINKVEEEKAQIISIDQPSIMSKTQENQILNCDCFHNQFPSNEPNNFKEIFHSLELDDPTLFRQKFLQHHSI